MLMMDGPARLARVVSAVGVVAVLAAACTGSSKNATVDATAGPSRTFVPAGMTVLGRISGTFMAVGGPANGHYPLAGHVAIQPASRSPVMGLPSGWLPVGADGTFSKAVAPGRYDVVGTSPQYNGGRTVCRATKYPVTVSAGEHVVVNVVCQMK
jgi:hypothetical protein